MDDLGEAQTRNIKMPEANERRILLQESTANGSRPSRSQQNGQVVMPASHQFESTLNKTPTTNPPRNSSASNSRRGKWEAACPFVLSGIKFRKLRGSLR